MSESNGEQVISKDQQNVIEQLKVAFDFVKKYAMKLGYEYMGYARNIKITLFVLLFFILGFAVSAIWILGWGLGYTDLTNAFTWGAWIAGDLCLVALGGGAFFTGFFLYILRYDLLKPIINQAVLLGFMCYLFTLVLLIFDIGQPIRCWIGYVYPNWGDGLMPNSMLTEVIWCLTFYFMILSIEMIPTVLQHKFIHGNIVIRKIAHYMHQLMWIAAAVGTFLSFFHQGSLGGGMWGVLYGKAVWYRPHLFFLAIIAAAAGGTSFITLCPWLAQKAMRKKFAHRETFRLLTKISGRMFIIYYVFRLYDIYTLHASYVPAFDRTYLDLWGGFYGIWMLVLELVLCLFPIILLNLRKFRNQENLMVIGAAGGVMGIITSKLSLLFHGISAPNFPWKTFLTYNPTPQEWFIAFGAVAISIVVYMFFSQYFPLFPGPDDEGDEQEAH